MAQRIHEPERANKRQASRGRGLSLLNDGWTCERRLLGRWGALDVFFKADAAQWAALGVRCWDGTLPGMTDVKRHDWGGVTQEGRVDGVGHFYFKRFKVRNPRFLYKPRRARLTVALQARAAQDAFIVPEAVCLIERRWIGLLVESAVVIKALDGWLSLSGLLETMPNDLIPSRDLKWTLLRAFGREVGRRHAAGLFHGDLHLRNVFCRRRDNGFEFAWIDNEEGAFRRTLTRAQRIHDLAHINRTRHGLTVTDRAVLWRAYLETADVPVELQRTVRRRVVNRTRRFWRKKGWLQ